MFCMNNYFVWATPSSRFAVVDLKVPNLYNALSKYCSQLMFPQERCGSCIQVIENESKVKNYFVWRTPSSRFAVVDLSVRSQKMTVCLHPSPSPSYPHPHIYTTTNRALINTVYTAQLTRTVQRCGINLPVTEEDIYRSFEQASRENHRAKSWSFLVVVDMLQRNTCTCLAATNSSVHAKPEGGCCSNLSRGKTFLSISELRNSLFTNTTLRILNGWPIYICLLFRQQQRKSTQRSQDWFAYACATGSPSVAAGTLRICMPGDCPRTYGRAYKSTRLTSQPDLQVNQIYKSTRLTSQPDLQVKQAYKSTRLTSQKQVTMIYENKRAMCSNSIYNKQR